MELAGLYLVSYLLGAVPTAYLIGKWVKGRDIREYGSGNVGGSNLFNHVGKAWLGALGLFEIFVKGAGPVLIGRYLLDLDRNSFALMIAPLLAIAGHNWSIFLKFQGGRGIAVASGSLLALSPFLLAAFIVAALAGWAVTRSSGFWVLVSLALLPLWSVLLSEPGMITWYCTGLLSMIVLKRLLSNWTPFPEGLPKRKVLFNRIFRDRDVDDRTQWVKRTPQGQP